MHENQTNNSAKKFSCKCFDNLIAILECKWHNVCERFGHRECFDVTLAIFTCWEYDCVYFVLFKCSNYGGFEENKSNVYILGNNFLYNYGARRGTQTQNYLKEEIIH